MNQEKSILKNKMQRKLLTIITVFALVITSLAGQSNISFASTAANKTAYTIQLNGNSSSSQTNDVGPADKMADGAILHAWCWSFNTIKNNMKDIAEAGYTSVQTSPANACVVGNGGSKAINNWYYIYQPTDYKVGNYQLGTESEFKAMCDEAEKYGIKIIVDVVANHVGNLEEASANLKACGQWYHTTRSISNWNSRYDVTQNALMGMPDLNTQNKAVQNYIRNYLLRLLDLGADGFRFDAAKHIELPEDPGFGGDFWPTVLNNSAEYQYGEILQDSISNEAGYAKYMNVTASNYGMKLRSAIGDNNFSTSNLMNFDINVANDKIVTWVESHDNYANGLNDWGSSEWMNDEQIKLAWAALAARKASTPLFFSRPVGGGGQNWDNRFPGKTQLGDRGSDLFMDDEVAAVNKFRNAMEGESEYLRNPNGDTKVLMIERGTKGAVIINLNYNEYSLSSVTNLKNGTYTNQTDNNNVFTVSNGRITGKLPARSVVVLFDYQENAPSVSIENCPTSFRSDSVALKLCSKNTTHATYSINGGTSYLYDNNDIITIGSGDSYNTTYTVELRGINEQGVTTSKTYTIKKVDPNAYTTIYFSKPSNWGNTVYAYVYNENGTVTENNGTWPGVAMSYTSSNGYYNYSFHEDWSNAKVIFSDGTNQTPEANKPGFAVNEDHLYDTSGDTGKVITETVTPSPSPSVVPSPSVSETPSGDKIYFTKPSSWNSNIYAYIYTESGSSVVKNAAWPGVAMSKESNGEYSCNIGINVTSDTRVIFSDGNNQTPGASKPGFIVTKGGHYDVNGATTTPTTTPSGNKVTIYYNTGWSSAYAHYKVGNGSWTTAPGVQMSNSSYNGYKTITIDLGTSTNLTACFNNGSGNWDSKNGSNYYFASAGTYTVSNGTISNGAPY